jgi:hypothetical protein
MDNECNMPGGEAKYMYIFYKKFLYKKAKM